MTDWVEGKMTNSPTLIQELVVLPECHLPFQKLPGTAVKNEYLIEKEIEGKEVFLKKLEKIIVLPKFEGPWWFSGRVSALGPEDSRPESRFHRRSAVHGACCTLNHTQWPNVLPLVWRGSLGSRGASSGVVFVIRPGSKLRGPSQNSRHVASKRDVNITKLNLTQV
ncbi:hypothetical protein AVEN_237664-1 [Araneus ventricosus]|uniref:Uncharacterized protein n=1 Tax=Araneus ventricosus TaxID=182803 RepID=A0A4Y2KBT5_ARAVE|nr:hypothetical protein AVEN_237664-1 [Araneus ventricosus]